MKEAYLFLYDIVIDKEALVESYLVRQGVGERRIWDVKFFCDFNDWELEIVVDFLLTLESNSPVSEDGDFMWWVPKKKGVFDIFSFYNALRGSYSVIFPWKGIWEAKVPRQVSFFVWTAAWGSILTSDNLRRRGFTIVDWCCMCRGSEEFVHHLLSL